MSVRSANPDDAGGAGEIPAIYLHPDRWSTGCGRELMAGAVHQLRTDGFVEATLWVLDTNARAIRFYTAAGWESDGTAKIDSSLDFELRELRFRRSWGR